MTFQNKTFKGKMGQFGINEGSVTLILYRNFTITLQINPLVIGLLGMRRISKCMTLRHPKAKKSIIVLFEKPLYSQVFV